jgi:hypothetical protein
VISVTDPRGRQSLFYRPEPLLFIHSLPNYPHEGEWTPFKTRHLSENLVASGTEPETPESVARNSDHLITQQSNIKRNLT